MPGAQRVPPSEEVPWLRAWVAELEADNDVMAAQLAARDAQLEAVQAEQIDRGAALMARSTVKMACSGRVHSDLQEYSNRRVTRVTLWRYSGHKVSRLPRVSGQDAEREAAVREVAPHGWTVARETARGYYVMRCSCGRHQTTMHKTPRLSNHFRNKVAWMIRQCSTRREGE